MNKKIAFCIICSFLLSGMDALASPYVSGISGAINHGGSITISGSGFGTKSTPAPLKWDDFESGTNGNELSGWILRDGHTPQVLAKYTNLNPKEGSTLSAAQYIQGTDRYFKYVIPGGTRRIFVSFWLRYDFGTAGAGDQIKIWRYCYNYPSEDTEPTIANFTFPIDDNWMYAIRPEGGSNKYYAKGYPNHVWVQVEAQGYMGTSSSNGSTEIWHGQESGAFVKVVNRHSDDLGGGGSLYWNDVMFGEYAAGCSATELFDDIYIDNTWQRVVLGDSATYDDCTVREVQIPTSWSSSSVTVKVNRGSFSIGSTAYLYVIDETGNISNSLPVVIGSSDVPTIRSGGVRSGGIR